MLKISMTYPGGEEELALAQRMLGHDSPEATLENGAVSQVITAEDLTQLRQCLENIVVREELLRYLVEIVRKTRMVDSVLVGAGPRATQALLLASRTYAALSGRDFVTPDDVKFMAVPVLEHRLTLRPEYEIEGLGVVEVIQSVLQDIAVPR